MRDTAGREGKIPLLGEVLAALPEGFPVNVELKRKRADPAALVAALGESLAAHPAVFVSSFDWPLLQLVKDALPGLPLAPLADRRPASLLAAARALDAAAVHCHHRLARRSFLGRAERAGRPVLAYTVNRRSTARRLIKLGVAGLFTDRPGPLRHELRGNRHG